jgi:hypothetical protein
MLVPDYRAHHPFDISVCAYLLARARIANLSLALAKDRVWCTRGSNASTLTVLFPTSRVIDPTVDLDGVHPNEVVLFDKPMV